MLCSKKRLAVLILFFFALCLPSFAAKEVIVLGQSSNGTTISYNVVFWFAISSGQLAQTAGSSWTGASAAENTAIQNGSVLEEQHSYSFPVGQDTTTIKAYILQAWAKRNQQIAGVGPAQFNGVFFDSISGWSA